MLHITGKEEKANARNRTNGGSQELEWATWVILVQGRNFHCKLVVLGPPGASWGSLGSASHLLTPHRLPGLQSLRGWVGIFTITSPASVA